MPPQKFFLCISVLLSLRGVRALVVSRKDFARMRCGTEKSVETIVSWNGTVFSLEPQKEQQTLFNIFGINLARCWQNASAGGWQFTSRELQYYLDKDTNLPLYRWENPWTNETVNVVHVANDPVQFTMGNDPTNYIIQGGEYATISENVNLFYKNPLSGNASYKPYGGWYEFYEGSELFNFFTPRSELFDESLKYAPSLHFSWTRISQWLPFMKMDGRSGQLLFAASGSRTGFHDLPQWLQDDINHRLPLYRHPPTCMLDVPDSTSWTYFAAHFQEFLNGDQFPVPVSQQPPCKLGSLSS